MSRRPLVTTIHMQMPCPRGEHMLVCAFGRNPDGADILQLLRYTYWHEPVPSLTNEESDRSSTVHHDARPGSPANSTLPYRENGRSAQDSCVCFQNFPKDVSIRQS